jgi:hypothetical protein
MLLTYSMSAILRLNPRLKIKVIGVVDYISRRR